MAVRVLFVGGTGAVGRASIPHLLAAGHDVAVAHTGTHEPSDLAQIEHLHGPREELLAAGGAAERWRPDTIVDTFAGGATAAKASQLAEVAARAGAGQLVAVSSMDVYRLCADAGVDGFPPAALPRDPLPVREDAPKRCGPSPGGGAAHDNVGMEAALGGAERMTVLRPGAIYGPYEDRRVLREWYLVCRVAAGARRLPLPDGGTQLFHRVAADRVGRAVAASVERAPAGRFECNVGDPRDLSFAGLAALVADRLGWEWSPEVVPWAVGDHPWNVRHPVLCDTTRLRETLGVTEPDPVTATLAQIDWLWERRARLAAL